MSNKIGTRVFDIQVMFSTVSWLARHLKSLEWATVSETTFNFDAPNYLSVINNLEDFCGKLPLPVTRHLLDEFKRSRSALGGKVYLTSQPVKEYARTGDALLRSLINEPGDIKSIPVVSAADISSFGDVETKLPEAVKDVREAIACLSCERPTAAVFHIMRALEAALRQLSRKLKVRLNPQRENWYQIVQAVDKIINSLGTKSYQQKEKKRQLGVIAAHLNSVRVAWRNEVMHPKDTYSLTEADEIMTAVKGLFREVCAIL